MHVYPKTAMPTYRAAYRVRMARVIWFVLGLIFVVSVFISIAL